jgi:hypothetical protein
MPTEFDETGVALETEAAPTQAMDRDRPEPEPERAALVTKWITRVNEAKNHPKIKNAFKRMREDMRFADGKQWPDHKENDDRYVADLVQRHLKQRAAGLYAKKPTVIAKRRPRLDYQLWDGKPASLMQAQEIMQTAQAVLSMPDIAATTGVAMPAPEQIQEAEMLLADVQAGTAMKRQIERIGKTLVALFNHYAHEQTPDFKTLMKQLIRREGTCGVGYIKVGFQREMTLRPDAEARIADVRERLAVIRRLAADLVDGETDPHAAEAEELRLAMEQIKKEPQVLVREGIIYSFPMATRIIPDPETRHVVGWVGTNWLAEEFLLSAEQVKETYEVDVGTSFTGYARNGASTTADSPLSYAGRTATEDNMVCVYEIYDRKTGLMMVVADGYPDFLREPAAPDVEVEQFYPHFPLMINDTESEEEIFPRSDVRLLRHIQREHNRTKESVRQHRIANRPLYAAPAGAFEEDEETTLEHHLPHEVIKIMGLAEGQPITDKLMAVPKVPIDPNVYETNHLMEDMVRTVGTHEARVGGTSGASATESSIAETGRAVTEKSSISDIDDLLTNVARASGQIFLREISTETVLRIAGPGAVWPEISAEDIVDELALEIKAGSSGRPNMEQDAARFERLYPLLVQVPGVSPRWLAERAIAILDDDADLEEAIIDGMPSIQAQNQIAGNPQPPTGNPETDPNSQGGQGADNGSKGVGSSGGPQAGFPAAA